MDFDFENNRYFGHATGVNPNNILENGLVINEDVYGKKNIRSTSFEIFESDLENGEENLVRNVFSIGFNDERKYLVIASFSKDEVEENFDKTELSMIEPENICGYYDEDCDFYSNDYIMKI